MRFSKLHGCGNAYVYVDCRGQRVDDPARLARAVSDARTGVGSDGLFLLHASDVAEVRAEMYNADGSRMAMCGNGIRCVGKLVAEARWGGVRELFPRQPTRELLSELAECPSSSLSPYWVPQVFRPGQDVAMTNPTSKDMGHPQKEAVDLPQTQEEGLLRGILRRTVRQIGESCEGGIAIHALRAETDAGLKKLWCYDVDGTVELVTADIGPASLRLAEMDCALTGETAIDREVEASGRTYRLTCVSTGSLHAVVFMDDIEGIDLAREGAAIERCAAFPDRANAHFVQVISPIHLRMRIWERGSGATRGCGTGACAAVVAGMASGRCEPSCVVDQPGGQQFVDVGDTVYLTGETRRVCDGAWCGT